MLLLALLLLLLIVPFASLDLAWNLHNPLNGLDFAGNLHNLFDGLPLEVHPLAVCGNLLGGARATLTLIRC